jgi:hypothetical protein
VSTALHEQARDVVNVRPAVLSAPAAQAYLGNIPRSALYTEVLPHVETIKVGSRVGFVTDSLDRFIEARKRSPKQLGPATA